MSSAQDWQEYRTRLLRFVRSRVSDPELAEDIVHDALVRAWERRDSLRNHDALVPWLFQITANEIRNKHRRVHESPLPEPNEVADVEVEQSSLQEYAACMQRMIDQLEPHYKAVFEQSEVHGVPMRAIAQEMGLSVSGVKSRVQRARAKVKASIIACCALELNTKGQITKGAECSC